MLPFSSRPDLINWVNGPAKADLGPTAEIDIPYGFSFAARNEAAALLQMMNNPVPDSLVGVLAPASRRYLIVFELNSVGYVKNAAHQNLDSKLILKYLRRTAENQNTNAPADDPNTIKWMEWKMKPKFDRDQNVVEWSILAETDSARTINHVVRLLGREGILDAIAVQSTESNETIPLRQLVAGISFNAGYTYADYHAGDKVAERNLAELIAGESSPELRTTGSNHLAYSLAGGALILLGAGVLAVRRKSRPTGRHSAHSVHAHAPLPARKPAVVHSTANGSAHSAIAPAKQPEKSAHNGNGKTSQPKLRRRRIFDYQRYYADLMSQVSDRAQETIAPAPARKVERTPAPVQRMDSHSIAAAAQAGLIESQKRLIEEQQRLIREQAKLIEEKTRVIQEKNQVLDKQTELFGNNIF